MASLRGMPLPIDRELAVAALSPYLPTIDVHGMRRDEVVFEVDQFLGRHHGQVVRVVFGSGEGILANEITGYLRKLTNEKPAKIAGFLVDSYVASCVIKV